jgi:hypothetical protein
MVNPLAILAAGLIWTSLPDGWRQGADGYFSGPQSGPIERKTPMLVISMEESSSKFAPDMALIRVRIFNNTETTVYESQDYSSEAGSFIFEVKNEKGGPVAPTQFFKDVKTANPVHAIEQSVKPWPLKPGDYCFSIIELSKDFDLKSGENYTLQLWKTFGLDPRYKTIKKVGSNILRFTASSF